MIPVEREVPTSSARDRPGRRPARVAVVGGGITGLTVARDLAIGGVDEVILIEADAVLGGKLRSSPFAGVEAVDEGPDAFLRRAPAAVALAEAVGLGSTLVSPADASAAVWFPTRRGDPLHPIPPGTVLGVPAGLGAFARSRLFTWRGKARAGLEPILPRTSTESDALGTYMRKRVGSEVHERLIDALVGSIYAADTDRSSLRAVPQLAALADANRSLLLGARAARARMASAPAGPIFAAPSGGLGALVDALEADLRHRNVTIRLGQAATSVQPTGASWQVHVETAGSEACETVDAVVFASPARRTASAMRDAAPATADLLGRLDVADVIMVTLAVPATRWPQRLQGRSGYLVPKPVQRLVTAVSFGSQKWAHWRPADGTQILRVSLGRDGLFVDHLDDRDASDAVIEELHTHLAVDLEPTATRVTRWSAAFPQYRPHHHRWVDEVEASLPAGLHLAGASYRGIGIPACVADANRVARDLLGAP